MSELDVFRSVDFNWTRQLRSIWRNPPYHVPSLHQERLNDIGDYFAKKTREADPADEPLGYVIVGPAGYGKTHLIGELRRRVWDTDGWFILLDFVGVKDFWSSVALGFLNSLQVRMPNGKTQYDRLFLKIASLLGIDQELRDIASRWQGKPRELVTELASIFVKSLSRLHFQETGTHRDVVTALILLISEDIDCHSIAHAWLQGMNLDANVVSPLGFLGPNDPIKVVQGLAWLMSLVGPTLIAVDQIDAIVSASNALARASNIGAKDEQEEAKSIVELLALGLMDLHEKKQRAVTVISCLEASWKVLQEKATAAVTHRYKSPANLRALPTRDIAAGMVAARLGQTYKTYDFKPPYPTWPFASSAFETAIGFSPRQLLMACEAHREHCVAVGEVRECVTFDLNGGEIREDNRLGKELDDVSARELTAAVVSGLKDAENEDRLRELFDMTLRLFEKHLDLPDDIDVEVQSDPDQRRPSLHGRLSFTFHSEGDHEHQYCFRILGHTNAIAFQSRLKAAMTASGIDTALKFRHLFILRSGDPPGGRVTRTLVDQFLKAGGKFVEPTDDDLRAFVALRAMAQRKFPDFDVWLRGRKPLFDTALFKTTGLCPPPFLSSPPPTTPREAQGEAETGRAKQVPLNEATTVTPPTDQRNGPRLVPIGRRFEHGKFGEAITLTADLLPRHVAVLAGPGSGKTVLMRRIVEEAALLGIPSIVLDPNNDLCRLGDAWPTRPESWSEEDAAKAETYRARADVVIWTPGVTSGNPISLNLLPDFAAIDEADEREQAIGMAWETLIPFLPAGGEKANRKKGVLADAIRRFAAGRGGALTDLIALLAELPDDVSEDSNAQKLASEIADQLRAAIAMNPLLKSIGEPLDPKTLFEGPSGKTRVSVINLVGLASEEARDSFVNRLQMSLFTFIKRNPNPTGCLYVIDEAQNFAPSGAGTACKASALSLAAQARKYGLGMMFATQTPKGVDNKIVSNCTTHVYGRMNAPATIDAIHDLMAAKGGAADDIGKLSKGEFYFSTEDSLRPFKVRTPLCLSWHPPNPPTAEEVIQKARSKRG